MVQAVLEQSVRRQLEDRRRRLRSTIADVGAADDLLRLLREVDGALERLPTGDFGRCLVCHESFEEEELLRNPLSNYCLCELSPAQQSALQRDLDLAWRVQAALLPPPDLAAAGWTFHYRYLPAGVVSGDYCDVLPADSARSGEAAVSFLLGDVSGKGVAASFLMARLHELMRALLEAGAGVPELMARANRHLFERSVASHYVTLVGGRASATGEVELSSAGHCRPLVVRREGVEEVDSTGFPLGLVADAVYESRRLHLAPGETLVLYTDGLTEAPGASGHRYGVDALARVLESHRPSPPHRLAAACLDDLAGFQAGATRVDDLTLMVIRRDGGS